MAEPTAAPETEEQLVKTKKGRRVKLSDEMEAMVDIEAILDELEGGAKRRVCAWFLDRIQEQEVK